MDYAHNHLPNTPPGGVTAGIDWASADHAVCVLDAAGKAVLRFTIEHTAAGLSTLVRRLHKTGVTEVAIERGDGPVIDTLLSNGLAVVVISPNQVKNLRSRYGSAGNKDDRFDAYVLADTLRTDRARLRPLTPDNPATVALRATVRARRDLVAHRIAVANQLRAHLQRVYPGAVGLFHDIDSPISLKFLTHFDTADAAARLTPQRLTTWLTSVSYSGRQQPATLLTHLRNAPPGATGEHAQTTAQVTQALITVLTSLVTQIKALETQITEQLARHTDKQIFTSLPRSGTIRAARLLAEIGDCRARFPDPQSLMCLAGVAPSTRQSGKHAKVSFRWAVNKQLRDAVCDFASDSRRANPWAAKLYNDARARGKDHPHATRILARAWLYVIWHCWHNHTGYDPARHNALQTILKQDQPATA